MPDNDSYLDEIEDTKLNRKNHRCHRQNIQGVKKEDTKEKLNEIKEKVVKETRYLSDVQEKTSRRLMEITKSI